MRNDKKSMQRSDLEHLLRAVGEISGDKEVIVIGSQSILGQFPDAPHELLASMEIDCYPRNHPELSDKVDGAIGEGSRFHALHGYYAQGVGPETAVLPEEWQKRLVTIENENTGGITGLCLEVHDLAIAKLVAGRPKDLQFVRVLSRREMINKKMMKARLRDTKVASELRKILTGRIKAVLL